MLKQLGSMPFSEAYLAETTVGHWVIENDPGKEPRMYADDVMLGLVGLDKPTSPEETFKAWLAGIDKNYMDSVMETERMNLAGIRAEVQYPWHYPDGHTILIRCEGIRNFAYKGGVRTEGRHRNITELVRLQKEAAVIEALAGDFECVNYVIINKNPTDDVTIPFRTSERLKAFIPGWENELNFHNRLELLVNKVGYKEDIQSFISQTRRNVVMEHLEKEPAYYVNARAVVEEGNVEYFQLKFMADRNAEGKVVGIIVGIHNIDKEMKAELEQREKVERLVAEKTEELSYKNRALSKVNERIIEMVGTIVEGRDEESGDHINRVKYLTRILAMQVMKDLPEYKLTVEDVSAIAAMSPLHDVGKISIPDAILLKRGRLTDAEFKIMKTHCDKGCEILESMSEGWDQNLAKLCYDICRYHHEKWDGRGYPCGLKGDEIPIAAQIVSIADAYDALVSERCYKPAFSHDKAYEMIVGGECGMYSDKLLACFTKCRDAFKESAAYTEHIDRTAENEELGFIRGGEYISDAVSFLEEISEAMPGGFFIYQADEEEKFIYFNDLMVQMLGCESREDFVAYTNNSFKGLVHPDDYEIVEEEIENQISEHKDWLDHVVYRIQQKDGGIRWIDDYGRFVKSEDMGDVFFVFVYDFTETYQRRNDLDDNAEQKSSGNGNSTKGTLTGLKVLVVDDSDMARELHKELLEDEGAIVTEAADGLQAVNAIKESMDYDLILMDLVMPVMSGVSAIREINKLLNEAGRHITIVCLTAEGSDMQVKEAMAAGAYECLYKPLNLSVLSSCIISSNLETTHMMERQLAETLKMANTDTLTNVKSIAAYTDKIAELTIEHAQDKDVQFGIVLCDCDKLKNVNDEFGHDVGDQYIINTSNAICETFAHSPVYRIGGDEFVVILQGSDYDNAEILLSKLKEKSVGKSSRATIEAGFANFSSGLAFYDRSRNDTVGDVIKRADEEMYENKRSKGNRG